MTDETSSPILGHLGHIRARLDGLSEGMTELKHRMTALEAAMGLVKRKSPSVVRTSTPSSNGPSRRPSPVSGPAP